MYRTINFLYFFDIVLQPESVVAGIYFSGMNSIEEFETPAQSFVFRMSIVHVYLGS